MYLPNAVSEQMDHTVAIIIQMTIFHRPRVIHRHACDFLQLTKYMCQKSKLYYGSGISILFIV